MNLSLCGALVLGSCATSSGGTYSRSVQADEAAARKSRSAKEASPGGSGGATGSTSNDSSFWSSTTSASTAIIITETPPHGTVKLLGLPFFVRRFLWTANITAAIPLTFRRVSTI
jgi:hypothetical protein